MTLYRIESRNKEGKFISYWTDSEEEAISLAKLCNFMKYTDIVVIHLGECYIDIQSTCYYVSWRD